MGFVGDAVSGIGKGIGKVLDVPILGDVLKLGSNFIPGVGPLISAGLTVLDQVTGEERPPQNQEEMQYAQARQQQQQAQFGRQPNQGDFTGEASQRYFDPWATQSDYNTADTAMGYADAFRGMSDQFGGYQDRAFDIYEQSMGEGGGMDWAEVERITSKMGSSAAEGYFGGDAGMEGSYQGQVQKAMQGMGSSGFAGGGMLGNAMMNSAKQGGQIFADTFDRNLGTIGGITQQDMASQRQASIAGLQNFTGAQLGAMESAYGADMSAAEVPYGRGISNNERWFNEQAQPELLKSLRYVPWYEQQARNIGEMGATDLYDYGIGQLGGWLGGGGGGGGGGQGSALPSWADPFAGNSNGSTDYGGNGTDWLGNTDRNEGW